MDNLHIFVTNDIAREFSKQMIRFGSSANGPWSFFASGGSLAPKLYQELAKQRDFWTPAAQMSVYLGDERVVDPETDASNAFTLGKALITPLNSNGSFPKVYPPFMKNDFTRLARLFRGNDADDYKVCQELADHYGETISKAPRPWLIHLGVGPDGHTASLFPGSPALTSTETSGKFYLANYDPNGLNPYSRLTLSREAIANSDAVIITASGHDKAKAIKGLLENDERLPIATVNAANINLIIDYEAASLVEE
ncbi:MAG: hypothetical protein EPN30_05480 [Actinomycetota bacterium]|nr:MAG: hypothetical protein EPN30_05480 [Actinomycetota bacterium]